MSEPQSPAEAIRVMSEDEAWGRLASVPIGRVAMSIADGVEIFPVNFVIDEDKSIYFRTAEGTKLLAAVLNKAVSFEADSYDKAKGWSVIVRASAERIERQADVEHAESLGLHPWTPTRKQNFVRLRPISISGRAFNFGPEPEDDW